MFRRETRKHVLPAAVVTVLSGPAMAQDLILEEVIVTAQKRVETLAETPMTVNVVTVDQIAEFGNFTISDINNMTTGLSIIGGGTDWDFAIRGVGTDINAPTVPRMSFYVDGSYFQQPRGLLTGLFDIAQLEILRGPQGTLYGQTSPMGAVTIRSQNPSLEEFDGYIRQSFTDRKGSNTQLAVSLPLIKDTNGKGRERERKMKKRRKMDEEEEKITRKGKRWTKKEKKKQITRKGKRWTKKKKKKTKEGK